MADEGEAAPAKKKSAFLAALIPGLAATAIAAGAGVALSALNPPPPPEKPAVSSAPGKIAAETKAPEKTDAEAAAVCAANGPGLVDLPPIVTNVATPADVWIRLEAAIVFDPKTLPHPELVAAEIATDELAYLRTVTITDLQGPIGLENIRQDLRDRAIVRSNGKVTELLLKTLVLQ